MGNPGKEYERTRHNAGFWLVEQLAARERVALRKDAKFQALVGRLAPSGAWLLLPQSYMNASGRPVQMFASFFRIPPGEILVAHDEVDFPPGVARLKLGGGIAGHNGLRDISQRLATHDYWRLRLGVGHPGDKNAVPDYVLSRPPAEERAAIDAAIERALAVIPLLLAGETQAAMQRLHTDPERAARKTAPAQATVPERAASPDADASPAIDGTPRARGARPSREPGRKA
ncbi:MAG: aminoacyl-tRNA hydrolase [Burkholderiales bacterium]|nr:aminoacyl-tRNA hydrolase [Burkholderiales bacterium]